MHFGAVTLNVRLTAQLLKVPSVRCTNLNLRRFDTPEQQYPIEETEGVQLEFVYRRRAGEFLGYVA